MLGGQLASEAAHDIEILLGRQAADELDLEALETAIRKQVLALAGRFLQQQLNADTSDYAGPQQPCACGGTARYGGRRAKTLQTALGALQLERAYYHCAACGRGWFPRDRAWGIQQSSLSPAVVRMVATVGAMVSFQEGSDLLQELAGVEVDTKQVERVAEALGEEIANDEKEDVEPLTAGALPPTLYLGMDGTAVPMRPSELAGRHGKQPDGSAKTREVKLCTVWSAESRDAQGRPTRDEASVSYSAAIESASSPDTDPHPSDFTQRVGREAARRRFTQAPHTVVLGDGAAWIWNIAQELFPDALQIVDRFHVKEHLSTLGKALYGADSPQATTWYHRRYQELDQGRFPALLRSVRRHADHNETARKCLAYLENNRQRMCYPQFEAQGFCTSTGVVEAGCKLVIGSRLKRAGMHWTVAGANAIAALRCSKLSGRFQNFWERRSEHSKIA